MVNVLESTLEWIKGEVVVNSGIGSLMYTTCFSLDSASVSRSHLRIRDESLAYAMRCATVCHELYLLYTVTVS